MNLDTSKQHLLTLRASLSACVSRETSRWPRRSSSRSATVTHPLVDEAEREDFSEAELDARILRKIRDALRRTD